MLREFYFLCKSSLKNNATAIVFGNVIRPKYSMITSRGPTQNFLRKLLKLNLGPETILWISIDLFLVHFLCMYANLIVFKRVIGCNISFL